MSPPEASRYLSEKYNIRRGTSRLAQLRMAGEGPTFVRVGRSILYPVQAIDTWVLEQAGIAPGS